MMGNKIIVVFKGQGEGIQSTSDTSKEPVNSSIKEKKTDWKAETE